MSERNAEPQAETPERPGRVGSSTAEGNRHARLADTACNDPARQPIVVTMEEVLSRENMLAAYQRVVGNKGAPGVDGVTVDELEPLIRQRWEAIREEVLSGTYVPNAVRKVEIPKPGGKGVRMLGIPTVLDRLIQQYCKCCNRRSTRRFRTTASAFVRGVVPIRHWIEPRSTLPPATAGWSTWTWRNSSTA